MTDLVRPVRIDPLGQTGPTRGRAAGPGWRRTAPGLFVPSGVDADRVEQRILEASALLTGRGVVTGWAALRLHGGGFFDGRAGDGRTTLPVQLAANGERVRSRAGVEISRFTVPDDEVLVVHGVRVAGVERALFDEMCRFVDPRRAAVAADMAFAARLTSLRRMLTYGADRRWYRDRRHVAGSLELSDQHSRSPKESEFRMIWEYDAGWGRPLCNRPLLDQDGRQVAIPDLIDPARGVVGEYAGADHRDIDRHEKDIAREATIRSVGLEYVEVVARDLRQPQLVVRRMNEAASRVRPDLWRWRLGSEPSPTLDEILDRRDRRRVE